jgi:hypothetical protein
MTEYSNSKRAKQEREANEELPEKVVEPVISGRAIVRKKSLGRRVKGLIVEADFQSVAGYLMGDVLVPAVKALLVDTVTRGAERAVYGDTAMQRRNYGMSSSKYQYSSPSSLFQSKPYPTYQDPRMDPRIAPQPSPGPRRSPRHSNHLEVMLRSKEEAELVIEKMSDILEIYSGVSVADFKQLLNETPDFTDNKWGWRTLQGVRVLPFREGWLIDIPDPEAW